MVHCCTDLSLSQMQTICNVFEICGFTMNATKFKYGQQIVFLGILIDSVTMTIRFDPSQLRAFVSSFKYTSMLFLSTNILTFTASVLFVAS